MKRRFLVTLVLILFAVTMVAVRSREHSPNAKITYSDSLDREAASVRGKILTLRDLAFYVAYEESEVERQAEQYYPNDPARYWNGHVDGVFIRTAARNAAIQMALHDEIFYQMAMEENVGLTGEEEESLARMQEDFWLDLSQEGQMQRLGVDREVIDGSVRKMMVAQKYQKIYSQMCDASYDEFDFTGVRYRDLLDGLEHEINRRVWERIDFGNLTIERGAKGNEAASLSTE